jgi:hypothetical protein
MYPTKGYNEDKGMGHVLFVAGKALRNFRSMLITECV